MRIFYCHELAMSSKTFDVSTPFLNGSVVSEWTRTSHVLGLLVHAAPRKLSGSYYWLKMTEFEDHHKCKKVDDGDQNTAGAKTVDLLD